MKALLPLAGKGTRMYPLGLRTPKCLLPILNKQILIWTLETLAANDYNIAVSSYVEAEDTREVVDITALNAEIARIVARQADLRTAIDEIVADLEGS